MTATDKLKKYLQHEDMEKGTAKDTLNKILDKLNEDNAEYLLNFLLTDVDAILTDKCREVPRQSTSLAELKQQYAVKCLKGIFVDFDVKEAEELSEIEANNLLRKLLRESLMQFHQRLEENESKIETQIVQKRPVLANPHMAEVLHNSVKTAQRAMYYKCLEAAVGGKDFEINNRSDTETLTSNLPIKKEKRRVAQHNPFLSKHQGRCPLCFKIQDVSKFNVSTTHYIKFRCSHCTKKTSIGKWFCLDCSRKNGKETAVCKSKGDDSVKRARKIEEGSKGKSERLTLSKPATGLRKCDNGEHSQNVRFSECVHYANLLSKQGKHVLSCPQTTCRGWRQLVMDARQWTGKFNGQAWMEMDEQACSMDKQCSECTGNWSIKQWFCTKCSGKGPKNADVKFEDCDCYTRLHHPLTAVSKKILTTSIKLRCPLHSCQAKRHFEDKDLPWVKKVRQIAATYMKCRVCRCRQSVWEWHCFKCKMKKYKCVCKKPQKQ